MTVAVWVVVVALFGHWLADFVWQPHWMSMRKSKEWMVLARHAYRITIGSGLVAVFALAFTASSWQDFRTTWWPLWFALINGITHFGIDAVTSRMTSRLYAKNRIHDFFVVIGFDQFLHIALTVALLGWLAA